MTMRRRKNNNPRRGLGGRVVPWLFLSLMVSFVLAFSVSCGIAQARVNRENSTHLRKGMTKQEVLKLMGHPLEDEVYNTDDVWYYFIESKWSDGMITRDECLPLFFENDRLMGWGRKELKKYKQRDW